MDPGASGQLFFQVLGEVFGVGPVEIRIGVDAGLDPQEALALEFFQKLVFLGPGRVPGELSHYDGHGSVAEGAEFLDNLGEFLQEGLELFPAKEAGKDGLAG